MFRRARGNTKTVVVEISRQPFIREDSENACADLRRRRVRRRLTLQCMSNVVRRRYAPKTVGVLRGFLEGLQGFSSVVHELLQNAEDAGASAFYVRLTSEALWVGNDGVFSPENFERLATPAAGSKRHDVEKIGSFGIGFISVFQLTDAPEIMSRGERHVLLPLEDSEDVTEGVAHEWPTTIRLPWAFRHTDLREGLGADVVRVDQFPDFLQEAHQALRESALFLDSVKVLRLMQDAELVEEIRIVDEVGRRTLVSLTGEQTFRLYSGEMTGLQVQQLGVQGERKPEITVAVPVRPPPAFQGRFYAYLPTQDLTLLPFHVNADFYPQADRKSLVWDGNGSTKQQWNSAVLRQVTRMLPHILDDMREEGPEGLYPFAETCLDGAALAFSSRAGWWLKSCAETAHLAFTQRPLLLNAHQHWVTADEVRLTVSGARLADHLRRRLEDRRQWSFLSEPDQDSYASLFRKLKVRVLDVSMFVDQLPVLFQSTADVEPGLDALGTALPALEYLSESLKQATGRDAIFGSKAAVFRSTPFAVNQARQLASLDDVWYIRPQWEETALDWWGAPTLLDPHWVERAAPELLEVADHLTPETLLHNFQSWDVDAVVEPLAEQAVRERLYAFLASSPFPKIKAQGLPLFPGKTEGLHPAEKLVLPGEIQDPFGQVVVAETHPPALESVLRHLDVRALDGDRYYQQMLPELARSREDLRADVLRHLAGSPYLHPERLAAWKQVEIVQTRSGRWVRPSATSFEHPLLEHLLEGDYDPVADALAKDSAVRRFLERLGVEAVPGAERLKQIAEEKADDPVDGKGIAFRSKLLEYALTHNELLVKLQNVRWLPDAQGLGWHRPGDLWPQQRKVIIGQQQEPDRSFLGLELKDEEITRVGLAEPAVKTVLSHLATLSRQDRPVPFEALSWLDQREGIAPDDQVLLRQVPLMEAGPSVYRPGSFFFKENHDLFPHRGLLSPDYATRLPRLMGWLAVKERPTAEDYARVLAEIAATLPESGVASSETADVIRICLEACGREWTALGKEEKDADPDWLRPLRQLRILPVVNDGRTYIYRPGDAFYNDMSSADIGRYRLQEALGYCADQVRQWQFLRALGVRSLRGGLQKTPLSTAAQGTPSAYTQQLQQLIPSLVRYLFSKGRQSPEQLEKELSQWRFVSLPEIRAEVRLPSLAVFRPQQVTLDFEVERPSKAILVSYDCGKYVPGVGLQRALRMENDDLLLTMFADPAGAEELLDTKEIPTLPPTFTPRHPRPAVEVHRPELPAAGASSGPTGIPSQISAPSSPGTPSPRPSGERPDTDTGATGMSAQPQSPHQPGGHSSSGRAQQASDPAERENPPRSSTQEQTAPSRPAPPAAEEWRARTQEAARNAGSRKERLASGVDGSGRTRPQGRFRRVGGRGRREPRLRYRSFVHVATADGHRSDPSEHNQKIDRIGMRFVKQFEFTMGRQPRDDSAETDGGYDYRSEGGGEVRYIEVKTLSEAWDASTVTMSRKQMYTAFRKGEEFWLYVVECALTQPRLWCLRNPGWVATSYTFAQDWANEGFSEGPFEFTLENCSST